MTAETALHPALLPRGRWREQVHQLETRDDVAVMIWVIVAAFVDDSAPLLVPAGGHPWETAEPYIREHAIQAEQNHMTYDQHSDAVIMLVLIELGLSDDYLRIKQDHQHVAFGEGDAVFRRTSPDACQVYETAGGRYLGTVQRLKVGQWWGLPPHSTDDPLTGRTRTEVVAALRDAPTAPDAGQ